ncbi:MULTISPECIES: Qat anti-phage system QueC-like protein QatC [unclassified Bradyrhizobium]|uniref:Qat anti-phage system QueC-like protein QatC n=1 Tax=unclassified Bradyrhizobium TaxID=2631580 RepID=UPI002915D5AF|nr:MULTISPECIES: Qat anti-phage system QueC-like protein QatC [unclassified Bradyrhizobium]
MTAYALIGHMGPTDHAPDLAGRWQAQFRVDLLSGNRTLGYGMGGVIRSLGRLGLYPSEVGVDVLVLAAMVHAADTRINRVQTSQDAWTRELGICVPVSDPELWTGQRALLEKMLRFLTGDHWAVSFRARPEGMADFIRRPVAGLQDHGFDGVALFSGGLDSLIGAIDRLEQGSFPLFVSHGGDGAISKPQKDLFFDLAAAYRDGDREPRRVRLGMAFTDKVSPGVGREESTRGRSFLFIALAAMVGSGLARHFSLEVPENGLIALNVPLDSVRLGSLSTRTTHPFYLRRWNELLSQVGIDGVIVNRYWDKTKGEMMENCLNQELLRELAGESLSCAHPAAGRWVKSAAGRHTHCGHCVPCIIRQAAFEHAWGRGSDPTGYRIDIHQNRLSTQTAEGKQVRAFQYAVARLAGRPDLARVIVHEPGPLLEDIAHLDALAGVYSRGIAEVGELLRDVKTFSPAAEAEMTA